MELFGSMVFWRWVWHLFGVGDRYYIHEGREGCSAALLLSDDCRSIASEEKYQNNSSARMANCGEVLELHDNSLLALPNTMILELSFYFR